jgi:hypothetical protein
LRLSAEQSLRYFLAQVVRATQHADGRWILGCTLSTRLNKDDIRSLIRGQALEAETESAHCPPRPAVETLAEPSLLPFPTRA